MSSSRNNQIQVSIRIKPFIKRHESSYPSLSIEDWIIDKSEPFAADVWSTQHSQSKVYDNFIEEQFLPSYEAGSNFTCFLYGQTGSGKTYTLFGPPDHFQVSSSSSSLTGNECPTYWGLFPRCISHFLTQSPSNKINIFVSMVELYQDQCYDLLNQT